MDSGKKSALLASECGTRYLVQASNEVGQLFGFPRTPILPKLFISRIVKNTIKSGTNSSDIFDSSTYLHQSLVSMLK